MAQYRFGGGSEMMCEGDKQGVFSALESHTMYVVIGYAVDLNLPLLQGWLPSWDMRRGLANTTICQRFIFYSQISESRSRYLWNS